VDEHRKLAEAGEHAEHSSATVAAAWEFGEPRTINARPTTNTNSSIPSTHADADALAVNAKAAAVATVAAAATTPRATQAGRTSGR
jgi:hypothetical protein